MNRPLRVLAVHHHPDLYGSDLMMLRTLVVLRDAGVEVSLVVPDQGPLLERVESAGIDYDVVPYPQLKKSLLRPGSIIGLSLQFPVHVARLIRQIRHHRPDLIYVNTLTLPHWAVAGVIARAPVLCHVRELESQVSRLVSRLLTAQLLLARTVVANSRATADYLRRDWPALDGRTHVVYNGLELPALRRPAATTGSPAETLTMALVGRLSPRKGQDVAIRALALLAADGLKPTLHLVGSVFPGYEWFEKELRQLTADLGVVDRVHFRGYLNNPWVALAPDIALVPSRVEPFGTVAAEAVAAGAATVVSNVGGLPEIIDHMRTGLVVPSDDPPSLAVAVASLCRNAALRRALVASGEAEVRVRFGRHRYAREMLTLMRSAAWNDHHRH